MWLAGYLREPMTQQILLQGPQIIVDSSENLLSGSAPAISRLPSNLVILSSGSPNKAVPVRSLAVTQSIAKPVPLVTRSGKVLTKLCLVSIL